MKNKGIGILYIVGIVAVVLVVAAAAALVIMLPQEQVIIDTTAFVGESNKEYPRALIAGQVIRVDIDVISGGPMAVSIWNDSTGETLWDSEADVYLTSRTFTIASSGTYIFQLVNMGDGYAQVQIKVAITSTSSVSSTNPTSLTYPTTTQLTELLEENLGYGAEEAYSIASIIQGAWNEVKNAFTNTVDRAVAFKSKLEEFGYWSFDEISAIMSLYHITANFTPAQFEVSNIIVPTEAMVSAPIDIVTTVRNTGELSGTYTITLKIDNRVEATRDVTLAGETEENISFTVIENEIGTYSVEVDGLYGTFRVLEAPPTTPVAQWCFDEGAGGTVYDNSGNSNTGTIYGATWTDGISGKALSFDGVNNYVTIPKLWSTSPSEVTVEAWVKPHSIGSGFIEIFYHGDGGELKLCTYQSKFRAAVKLNGADWYNCYTTWTPSAENWYYLALVWKRNEKVRLYVNGVLEAETAVPDCALYDPGGSYPARIGCYGQNIEFWDGVIDEVRVYNGTRTASEILADYQATA